MEGGSIMPAASPHAPACIRSRRPRRPGRVAAAVALSTVVLVLAGCGSAEKVTTLGPEKPDLTVAVVPAAGPAGLYIAQTKGFFTAAGLHVTIKNVTSGSDAIADLIHGSVDVDQGQWTSDLGAEAAGMVQLHALAAGNAGAPGVEQLMVPPGSPIRSVKDLAGKTVAVNALNGLPQFLTGTVLAANGISPSQVHFVAVPFPAMGKALLAHRVDAAFMIEPFLTQAEDTTGLVTLFDLNDGPLPGLALTGYVTTQTWMARYPETAAAFTAALARGQRLAATSRPDVEKALATYTTISKQTAAVMATGTFPQSVTTAALVRVADLMVQQGGLKLPKALSAGRLAEEMTR
jgi:NitT/TauT family transport system substrate-binding protein